MKPLELNVGGSLPIRFSSPKEFEFSLAGRISLPAQKISALMKRSPRELMAEAGTIDDLEKRLQTMLARIDDISGSPSMLSLDPAIFSHDHNWRGIITELNDYGDEYREYKVVALNMYIKYLHARKLLLKDLYAEKRANIVGDSEDKDSPVATGEDKMGDTSGPANNMPDVLSEASPSAREKRNQEPVSKRLPKGEPVVVPILAGEIIEIRLSKHKFSLTNSDSMALVDPKGHYYPLVKGRNIIGRDMQCTISLNPSFKDISRRHLIIENNVDNELQLTDISSHGTFVVQ